MIQEHVFSSFHSNESEINFLIGQVRGLQESINVINDYLREMDRDADSEL